LPSPFTPSLLSFFPIISFIHSAESISFGPFPFLHLVSSPLPSSIHFFLPLTVQFFRFSRSTKMNEWDGREWMELME
jgi:hypothetical protein